MRPSSAKAKGRRLQQALADVLRVALNLPEEDVKPAIMGERGVDIHLSARARAVFPFAVECKNQEALNIWAALEQAEENAGSLTPLLVFKRNRTRTWAALPLESLIDLCRRLDERGTTYTPTSPLDRD